MLIMHRKWPAKDGRKSWDYKGIQERTTNEVGKPIDVTFYTLTEGKKKSSGVEIYSGRNYVLGSNSPSHSRTYKLTSTPSRYKTLVNQLRRKHASISWSTEKEVNLN